MSDIVRTNGANAATLIGGALAAARRALGLTRADVADQLGVTVKEVRRIERGEGDPYLSSMQAYARAVGLRLRFDVEIPIAPAITVEEADRG